MALPIAAELLTGEKLSLDTIKDMVIKHGFGVTPFEFEGVLCGMSHGINYALLSKSIQVEEIESALRRFMARDYNTFYDWSETPQVGYEYGEYPSSLGSKSTTGAIMVHTELSPKVPWNVVVYFQFER